MEPESSDLAVQLAALQARVEALEAQLARFAAPRPAAPAGAPSTPGTPRPQAARVPLPAPPPAEPRKPANPGLIIALLGAGLFLLGAIFFLGWSIQQGWLGPAPRMGLGLLAGAGMAAGAARLILKGTRKLGVCVLAAGLGTFMLSLYYGSASAHLISPGLGFGGTAVAVVFAGALAARAKSGGALGAALIVGCLAPIAFSEGGHHEIALAVYLAALLGAALLVPMLSGTGGRWLGSRILAFLGINALLCAACLDVLKADTGTLLALLALHGLLAGLWLWLPKHPERPIGALLLWMLEDAALAGLAWAVWRQGGWMTEGFAGPLLLLGAVNLALVKPLRARLGDRSADLGLLALAAAHLALALPVALAWSWAGLSWGLLALCFAAAAALAEDREDEGLKPLHLQLLALGFSLLASGRWLAAAVDQWDASSVSPFFNAAFATGLLAFGAWALMARKGTLRILGFLGAEGLGHILLPLEIAYALSKDGAPWHRAGLAFTFTWALSGATHWLLSLRREGPEGTALAAAGYVWLGLASLKLIVVDLSGANLGWRALAFLLVGGLFLAAALLGQRLRPREDA
ncbi:MAG TPA: DUF2339 domain-containing protein [Holophagaceae bacterium]|nr:DUF2339 domain-containing protein [Holophagaceae bacterium]